MLVRCPDCDARYEVTTPVSLDKKVNVRCPRCKAVFPVQGGVQAGGVGSVSPALGESAAGEADPGEGRPRVLVTDPSLARRLARAMISEIVLNRQREREAALAAGTLLSRFGPAVVSAYDLYCSKVSPALRAASPIFREAVNEVLGQGKPVL